MSEDQYANHEDSTSSFDLDFTQNFVPSNDAVTHRAQLFSPDDNFSERGYETLFKRTEKTRNQQLNGDYSMTLWGDPRNRRNQAHQSQLPFWISLL